MRKKLVLHSQNDEKKTYNKAGGKESAIGEPLPAFFSIVG